MLILHLSMLSLCHFYGNLIYNKVVI